MLNRFEQFSYVVSGINRYIQKIERDEMEKFGYKGSYAQYLVVLERFDEGVTMSKLCELCDRDKAAVSRVITEMEGKGLVEKKKVDDKVYRSHIVLTEEGKKVANFVCKRAKDAVMAIGDDVMSDDERRAFYFALDTISKKLEAMTKEGIPHK